MLVQDVMTMNPAVIAPNASIGQALEVMRTADVRHLPVASRHELMGMVSDRDLGDTMQRVYVAQLEGHGATEALTVPVSKIMQSDVVTVGPEDELIEAANLLVDHRIGALPVVVPHSGNLVGIVSYVDILRAVRPML